jgi:hypothetical protein
MGYFLGRFFHTEHLVALAVVSSVMDDEIVLSAK